jgi:nucleoside-diphosphate-sugar epimerase
MAAVLVTGANGFIGRRVVAAARGAGCDVTALVRTSPKPHAPCVVEHDLRLPLKGLPRFDWVFHLAGGYAGANLAELQSADLRMAENILEWGLAAGVRNWVFASAAEVYGDVDGIASETSPTLPVIPYGRIKLAIERKFTESLVNVPDGRLVILRIGEVYGSLSRLIGELAVRLQRGFCPWPGSARVRLSFVHVDDVAQMFVCALRRARPGISTYNVADDVPATWREFVSDVARRLGARAPSFLPAPMVYGYAGCSTVASRMARRQPILTRHAVRLLLTPKALSNVRAKCELGFQPQYQSFEEGMEEALGGLSHYAEDGAA